jgi:dihydrofolate reductase
MKRVIFQMSVSLDGSIEGPNHEIDWHTDADNDPVVKEHMNSTPKLVFSRTLKKVEWQNSRVAAGSIVDEVARLKQVPGDGLLPVGGSELAACLLEQGLIDELRIIHTTIPFPAAFIYSI